MTLRVTPNVPPARRSSKLLEKWPDIRLAWRHVWFGAMVTAALFTVGKYAIGLYLGRASIGSAYGAAGSVVVLLVWVYYAALIVFAGAEITRFRAQRRGAFVAANEAAHVTARPANC